MSEAEPPAAPEHESVAPGEELVWAEVHEVAPAAAPAAPSRLATIQVAAVAAGSFAAGATVALIAQALARKAAGTALTPPAAGSPLAQPPKTGWPVVGSRRYIVDVHLFGE